MSQVCLYLTPIAVYPARFASFEVDLNTANGGFFECKLDVSFFGDTAKRLQLKVNFKDLFGVALELAEEAFDGIKSLF